VHAGKQIHPDSPRTKANEFVGSLVSPTCWLLWLLWLCLLKKRRHLMMMLSFAPTEPTAIIQFF
jgi:hypothetical protein